VKGELNEKRHRNSMAGKVNPHELRSTTELDYTGCGTEFVKPIKGVKDKYLYGIQHED